MFRTRLADHVAAMEDDEVALVEAESTVDEEDAGTAPYVQFCAWGKDLVRCELSSNAYLAAEHRLDDEQTNALVALGWLVPTVGQHDEADSGSTNFFVDAERNQADRLAAMTVHALRDVFGVRHPAFLTSEHLDTVGVSDAGPTDDPAVEEVLAVQPDDRDHLSALVDQALVPVFGGLPEHDEDDDVPVPHRSGLVWVQVMQDAPVVHLFSAVVWDVQDLERAVFEVAVLNRDVPFLKFLLVEDAVMAHLYVPALPFAPLHLRTMLDLMGRTLDRIDVDLAARVSGQSAFVGSGPDEESHQTDTSQHPALRTLLELETEEPGSVDAHLAAGICGHDSGLVLELIEWTTEQATPAAERLVSLLRRALRLIVEPADGRPERSPCDAPARGRRPRDRDEVLPGLDSREPGLFDQ